MTVTIYQGVTLGGTGKEKGKETSDTSDNVLVASGAKVLGSITIGENSKVGAGSVVLKDVPTEFDGCWNPGESRYFEWCKSETKLDHQDMPDPVADRCNMT